MTTPTLPLDQFTTIAKRGQEAVTAAVQTWTETAQRYVTSYSPEAPLPTAADVHTVTNAYFDLVAQLVADQRTLAAELIDTGAKATETLTSQARSFTTN